MSDPDLLPTSPMPEGDDVLFDAVLRPSPAMPPAVLCRIIAAVLAINLLFVGAFVMQGAWPVMPFMGLDIGLLIWAFVASSRASRQHEQIVLTPSKLLLKRSPPHGPPTEVALNPYWVRVEMGDPARSGSQLTVWSHGRGFCVGSFLSPEERAKFARALKAAIRSAREPIRRE